MERTSNIKECHCSFKFMGPIVICKPCQLAFAEQSKARPPFGKEQRLAYLSAEAFMQYESDLQFQMDQDLNYNKQKEALQ